MSEFKNAQKLWTLISEDSVKGNFESKYSKEAFFKDLRRSYEQLYINGILSDSILHKAQNQINVVTDGIHAICSAAKILEKELDNIKDAYEKIASIPGIETDSFETGLLDATKLLGLESDPIGVAFRNFCSIRRDILSLKSKINVEKEKSEEKLTQIKNKLLSTASLLHIDTDQIDAMFLDEAANEIFNPLFENKENSESEQTWEFKKNTQKDYLKKFLKLFLHQNFIFSNATILNKLGDGYYLFNNPNKRRIELSYTDDDLIIKEIFFTKKVIDSNTFETFETKDEDFFVKGIAIYKINIYSYNIDGWVAKYGLIDSTLECKEKFKAILDTRNILEKFREFLVTSLDKIIAYLNIDKPGKNKSKFKPLFFVSNTGSSVSEVISDTTESNRNILNLIINNIK
jgi:hypothetical protein